MKAIISLGYVNYVMETKDALLIAEMLSKAEIYEENYRSGGTAHHIYDNDKTDIGVLRLVSDAFYQIAKLAGRPAEKK